jgi:DNA (cytosine-5)-methyltransferase 1
MRVVDYFAGLGGFTEGATRAGASVVAAINHWPVAVATHAQNHPAVTHACEDLTRYSPARLPAFDVLVAAPACQGHSPSRGVAPGSEGDARWDDSRATAWSVIDCAEVRRPRAIVVENVPAFARWSLFPTWLDALSRLGYAPTVQVLNAADWGVPQDRPRVIVTAIRGRTSPGVVAPMRAHRGIGWVIRWEDGEWSPVARKGRSDATLARVARGRAAYGDRFVMPYNGSGSGLTGRDLSRPIGTITAADRWAVVRGDEMRMLTVDELREAMGFPSGYAMPVTRENATKALGNAIVPAVAEAAVRTVMEAA